MRGKKTLAIVIILILLGAGAGYYMYTHHGSGLVILTVESEKSRYSMGENVNIIVKVKAINVDNFEVVASSKYPCVDGIYIFYFPSLKELKNVTSQISQGTYYSIPPGSEYYGLIHFDITEQKTYRYLWNDSVFYVGDVNSDPENVHYYRAPAGYYLLYIEGIQKWKLWDNNTEFKIVYNNMSYFYLGGLNYTIKNNLLHINSSSPLQFEGKLEIWEHNELNNSESYYRTISFNYTGMGISLNLSKYLSPGKDYTLYLDTPYGKYRVGSYESSAGKKS